MPPRALPPLRFLRFVLRRFLRDRCPQTAAALAYTTLLALVPLITVALAVLAAFPVFGELMTALKVFLLTHMVPEIAGRIITVYMVQFSEKASRLTLVGLFLLVLTALLLMHAIEEAFNTIWRVAKPRPLVQRFLSYWAVLTTGPLLLGASLSVTSYLASLSLGYASQIPWLGVHLLRPLPALLMALAFALLYTLVPNRTVAFRHAVVGGLAAGIGFQVMQSAFTWYVTHFPTFRLVYGAFAALPIFLVWLYASWLVVLLGATLTAALPAWPGAEEGNNLPGWRFVAALELAGRLVLAQQQGVPLATAALLGPPAAASDEREALLPRLAEAGIVARTDDGRWLLARPASAITVGELARLFLWDGRVAAESSNTRIRHFLETLNHAAEPALAQSLGELFLSPESVS
ncbi:MAG: YihY family inner membrane protein [Burkholderiales bacterium]|nr:YihY family inner membrane protein [Burkholderiales bacterium]